MPALDDASRSLYAQLAVSGPTAIEELDAAAMHALNAVGLLDVEDGFADVLPPAGPLLDLIAEHARRSAAAHGAIEDLTSIWRSARSHEIGAEVLSGQAADREFTRRLSTVQDEVLALSIGPMAVTTIRPAPGVLDALARGVDVRAVYHSRLFENPAIVEVVEACIEAGEQVRVFPRVPMNLVIVDDFATMSVSYDSDEPIHLACVHNRRMVETLRAIFHSFWQLSTPFGAKSAHVPVPDEHRELVRLLSLGITDRAIAHELGVSERTVGRRVTALQDRLGVDTRLQLGLQLAIQGWV